MLYIAHRGACMHHPENSMAAIRLALEQDFDGIEFDVRASRDNKLFLLHDKRLGRTTNSRGLLSGKSSSHANSVLLFNDEQLPSIETVFEALRKGLGRKLLFLELKDPGYESIVLKILKRYGLYSRTIISSRSRKVIQATRRIDKKIRIELESPMPNDDDISFAKRLGCWSVCFEAALSRRSTIMRLKRLKIKSLVTFWIFDYAIWYAQTLPIDGMFVRSINARMK